MHNVTFSRRAMSWIVSLALLTTLLPISAFAAVGDASVDNTDALVNQTDSVEGMDNTQDDEEAPKDNLEGNNDSVEDDEDIALLSDDGTETGYYLMNIPYAEFYDAIDAADNTDFDAISSATNKVGNYGKSGGSFHSGTSASVSGGTVTAVGGANGAKNEGVIWPVKISADDLTSLGDSEIRANAEKTIATVGRGQTSASYLYSYECLTEAAAYSYYALDKAPDNYLEVIDVSNGKPVFGTGGESNAVSKRADVTASYGTNWGDVQLKIEGVDDVTNLLVNAVVITTENEDNVGLVHLYNVWSPTDIAWRADKVHGLDGKKITNIRYYCAIKDDTVAEGNDDAPEYQNYIYDYSVNDLEIPPVYYGSVTARFTSAGNIQLTGLPEDIQNPTAKVYHSEGGGHHAALTYLTPLEVDPADQDIDPVNEDVKNGLVTISPTLVTVTNANNNSKTYGQPVNNTEYTIEISSDNWIIKKVNTTYTAPVSADYILMNIPYETFYNAVGTTQGSTQYDAISSATNKVGNYGKSGGSFHSAKSAGIDEEGSITAVGGENGAKNEGVTWPVAVTGGAAVLSRLEALGGREVTSDSAVTVATVGRGQTSSSKLVSYEALNEAPAYSYHVLGSAPTNYLQLSLNGENLLFAAGTESAVSKTANPTASYGTNWGDVQLKINDAVDAGNAIINAVVLTAADEKKAGLVHLYNVWSASDIAWKAATVSGLDGKQIINIRYYCTVKDDTVSEANNNAPAYQNYIYDYSVSDLNIPPVYTGTVSARFDTNGNIVLTGLPADIQNPKAKVYHSEGGGHHATLTYLTPLEVDPADQDIDPVNTEIVNGKITVSPTLVTVTNDKGESQTYGRPVDGTEYTVEISCDNWIVPKATTTYIVSRPSVEPDREPDDSSSSRKPNKKNQQQLQYFQQQLR